MRGGEKSACERMKPSASSTVLVSCSYHLIGLHRHTEDTVSDLCFAHHLGDSGSPDEQEEGGEEEGDGKATGKSSTSTVGRLLPGRLSARLPLSFASHLSVVQAR